MYNQDQQGYNPYGHQNQEMMHAPVMKVSEWLLTIFLLGIPLVNIILLIVWAVDKAGNPNRSNYAKAVLVFIAIAFVLYLVIFGFALGMVSGLSDLL